MKNVFVVILLTLSFIFIGAVSSFAAGGGGETPPATPDSLDLNLEIHGRDSFNDVVWGFAGYRLEWSVSGYEVATSLAFDTDWYITRRIPNPEYTWEAPGGATGSYLNTVTSWTSFFSYFVGSNLVSTDPQKTGISENSHTHGPGLQ